ncbi:MAG: polysaccharide biosynthesis protein [Chloroflexi bacterium]|nr:polysaccharide biosynthesis protein [Chloroflexota bacterium]
MTSWQPLLPPRGWRLVAAQGTVGAAAYALAMALRFVDEGSIPTTYALRLIPWALVGAVQAIGAGALAARLRRPHAALADRPVTPFVVAGLVSVVVVLGINRLLPVGFTLPTSVAVIGPLLASAGVAALHVASARSAFAPDDLLGRRTVQLDVDACAPVLSGKHVLITGAAGSIGTELARQVLTLGPSLLTLVDVNETGLFELDAALAPQRDGVPVRLRMADVADRRRIQQLFAEEQPSAVFHAAAYKHVPMVEANPEQGFSSNVLGTLTVCEAAIAAGAERVVVISTDKAVNPTSVMGLTKRVAELLVAGLGSQTPGTVLSAVRFGNVLGSRGSVVPTLMRQIDAGGPLTITHPDAYRYFMTISEAANLVLRTATNDASGAVFVLDMGEELRIVDLAERLVRLRGLRPGRDVAIEYIGLRPGERLHEQLIGTGERLVETDQPWVLRVAADYSVDAGEVLGGVEALDARRRGGGLAPDAYAPALQALVDAAVRPAQPSLA